jgi:signal peptidase II
MNRRVLAAAIVVVVVVLDQLTKIWAVAALSDEPIDIVGDTVRFQLARNAGGAFSFVSGAGVTPVLALIAIGVAIYLVRMVGRAEGRLMLVALALILGGALGNLCDRFVRSPGFLRGEVIDFVSVGLWPIFNVADSALSIGIVLLLVASFRSPASQGADEQPSSA